MFEDVVEPYVTFATHTITSSDGNEIVFTYEPGGRGGLCEALSDERPHQSSNTCPTWEALQFNNIENSGGLSLSRMKYTNENGTVFYSGVEENSDIEEFSLEINEPYMGLLVDFSVVRTKSGYLVIKTPKDSVESFLDSEENLEVEEILRTVKISN